MYLKLPVLIRKNSPQNNRKLKTLLVTQSYFLKKEEITVSLNHIPFMITR